ncbi:hypothetical protein [Clostridium sp. CCUG 7971]|uniref:hypothetical protein n=1 Tax=Clostridium sp. CCUG 7971 TaxID=2811414 RepID=UPI001ABAD543|nr:hypothetical protein [Clostridium sp. CCUG 7971]MBO3446211.1 hypothetical protein [Clostridium sp. CCUG 7971]
MMNFDMFSSKQNDDMDPNYIYPKPYIDPMMYINPYTMNGMPFQNNQMDPNMANSGYMTYMNPCMNNSMMGQCPNPENDNDFDYEDMNDFYMDMANPMQCMPNNMMPQNMPMMNGMMMPPGMPMMNGMMIPPGMPMMNGMMMPQGMPMMNGMMMPWMMSPYMMMPGMPQIHMEEFDEEEM